MISFLGGLCRRSRSGGKRKGKWERQEVRVVLQLLNAPPSNRLLPSLRFPLRASAVLPPPSPFISPFPLGPLPVCASALRRPPFQCRPPLQLAPETTGPPRRPGPCTCGSPPRRSRSGRAAWGRPGSTGRHRRTRYAHVTPDLSARFPTQRDWGTRLPRNREFLSPIYFDTLRPCNAWPLRPLPYAKRLGDGIVTQL